MGTNDQTLSAVSLKNIGQRVVMVSGGTFLQKQTNFTVQSFVSKYYGLIIENNACP